MLFRSLAHAWLTCEQHTLTGDQPAAQHAVELGHPSAGALDLPDRNLTSVGAYTDRMRAAAPGKAVAMVLQGFGWRDIVTRSPVTPDTRFNIGTAASVVAAAVAPPAAP